MKVAVQGLWHLGSVTAACLAAAGFDTVGIDENPAVLDGLRSGKPPIFEMDLAGLIQSGIASGKLSFADSEKAAADCDLVWVAFDTPVDDDDRADVAFVTHRIRKLFPHLKDGATVLISSQLPAGATRILRDAFAERYPDRTVHFAYSPENLRLGQAIKVFTQSERIVIGTFEEAPRLFLEKILSRFCTNLIWMRVESAEMVKHALNTFLAVSVTFANEIATICEFVGADAGEVERGLRSEPRVGAKAYIRAGGPFAGGTLARDINFLNNLASAHQRRLPMIGAILDSNAEHRAWPFHQVSSRLTPADGPITVLGLSYKVGSDVTRRSLAVELCRDLLKAGYAVRAADPAVRMLPDDLEGHIKISQNATDALQGAAAAVIATEWPDFNTLDGGTVRALMKRPMIFDQNRFLSKALDVDGVDYITVGISR